MIQTYKNSDKEGDGVIIEPNPHKRAANYPTTALGALYFCGELNIDNKLIKLLDKKLIQTLLTYVVSSKCLILIFLTAKSSSIFILMHVRRAFEKQQIYDHYSSCAQARNKFFALLLRTTFHGSTTII